MEFEENHSPLKKMLPPINSMRFVGTDDVNDSKIPFGAEDLHNSDDEITIRQHFGVKGINPTHPSTKSKSQNPIFAK